MKYINTHLLLIQSVLSVAIGANVDMIWRHEVGSSRSSISILDPSTNKLLAQTCGDILQGDSPIDFSNVSSKGFGAFTVGTKNYTAHSLPEFSGGPTCTKIYANDFAVVDCEDVEWDPKNAVNTTNANCFELEGTKRTFRVLDRRVVRDDSHTAHQATVRKASLERRQGIGACQGGQVTTKLKGDGSPRPAHYYTQLSEPINCGTAPGCSVGETNSKSLTIGWSATGAGGASFPWISGGFSVTESWTTGNSYTCNGNTNEEVCIWYNIAHTEYSVIEQTAICPSGTYDKDETIRSPNKNNAGGGYYCVIGTCRNQGDGYWA